ncbi:hypothetical protein DFH09DRAFT_1444402 [Mycena vulgaris]|nr:hypothetical protein DFH09DRAFT_1444402 [Mycena vulgaris]
MSSSSLLLILFSPPHHPPNANPLLVPEPPLTPTSAPLFSPTAPTLHAAHVRLVSWFLDATAAPFGVHRMALADKAAGKDVGMWFGPSATAGALRTLVDAYPMCGLGVSVATDGTLYQRRCSRLYTRPPPSRCAIALASVFGAQLIALARCLPEELAADAPIPISPGDVLVALQRAQAGWETLSKEDQEVVTKAFTQR